MSIIQILLYVLILLTALPVGWLLAWLCRDELVDGRKWFFRIIYAAIIILVVSLLVWRDAPTAFSMLYLIAITSISIYKSRKSKERQRG